MYTSCHGATNVMTNCTIVTYYWHLHKSNETISVTYLYCK